MSTFSFKRFSVVNEHSAMKVGTDGVLLGAAVCIDGAMCHVLDVGTGTGTIALMLAQRLSDAGSAQFSITGIDIDGPSAEEAGANFTASPWAAHLQACLKPLQQYVPAEPVDLIVSNPPYFDNSLQAEGERRNSARHTEVPSQGGESLSYRDLAVFASAHLSPSGRLSLILPSDQEHALVRCMASYSLYMRRIMRIRTTQRKPVCRIVAEFGRIRTVPVEEFLTIQDGGAYTPEYLALTHEFYLFA